MLSFIGYLLYAPQVDADDNRVRKSHLVPVNNFLPVRLQHIPVVRNPVTYRMVGGIDIQTGTQGLVKDIYHIERPCVFVQIHVQGLVFHSGITAVFVQQLVTKLQCGTGQ